MSVGLFVEKMKWNETEMKQKWHFGGNETLYYFLEKNVVLSNRD